MPLTTMAMTQWHRETRNGQQRRIELWKKIMTRPGRSTADIMNAIDHHGNDAMAQRDTKWAAKKNQSVEKKM
jgi:hypothetical protein